MAFEFGTAPPTINKSPTPVLAVDESLPFRYKNPLPAQATEPVDSGPKTPSQNTRNTPAPTTSVEPVTGKSTTNGSPRKTQESSPQQEPRIPVDGTVFYNEETLKYMRIIDMYKKLGVGKDIELPRVLKCIQSVLFSVLTGYSSSLPEPNLVENQVYSRT